MTDQRDDAVRRVVHCRGKSTTTLSSREIPEGLLDEAVTTIIQETAAEIADGFR